jgi:hypothetical protein
VGPVVALGTTAMLARRLAALPRSPS